MGNKRIKGMESFDEIVELLEKYGFRFAYIEMPAEPTLYGTREDGLSIYADSKINYNWKKEGDPKWYLDNIELSLDGKKIYRGVWFDEDHMIEVLNSVNLLHF